MISAADAPLVVDNIYGLIYAILLLALGGGAVSVINGFRIVRQQRKEGRKDKIGELEDWANELVKQRDFYMHQSAWRNDLNGRLIFVINTCPMHGADTVQKVLDSMPPEPHETDRGENHDTRT